jgi:hypothetical protein
MATLRDELYRRELRPTPKPGEKVLYRHDTWHRGTLVNKGHVRNVMNLVFKSKSAYWVNVWNRDWTYKIFDGTVERMLKELPPDQRTLLGIPSVGDPYWTKALKPT